MTRVICSHDKCTGCAVCRDVCPKKCISMQPDELDTLYPVIDEVTCVTCGICEKACPNNTLQVFHKSQRVYAAWSNDKETRRTSASGGIACELYRYWLRCGGLAAGVVCDNDARCHFTLIEKEDDISFVQNSKYTFSNTDRIYKAIKERLDNGIPILFIGVPCQIAALYCYLKKDYDKLTTVDIICHGMPPSSYLQQHVKSIEEKKRKQADKISFRDPEFFTFTFTFTLRDISNRVFYRRKVLNTDNYQLGYHRALIYRENCYSCLYARRERVADLTIGDFSGLGRYAEFPYEKRNVSCVLQNTHKGARLLSKMTTALTFVERPESEAFDFEHQLQSPSVKHPKRQLFEKEYKRSKDFKQASDKALACEKIKALKEAVLQCLKTFVYRVLVISGLR